MIKEIIDKLVALLAVSALLASCSESELWQNPQTEARDGYIMLNFKTEIPAMQEVVTRAVDPDGGGVQDMTLFCFDSYGLFHLYRQGRCHGAEARPGGDGGHIQG
jgi:hypothetical protein